jgi:predicted lipid-binding transport protein (Tim44 family)
MNIDNSAAQPQRNSHLAAQADFRTGHYGRAETGHFKGIQCSSSDAKNPRSADMNRKKGLSMIKNTTGNAERGIALFFTMFALLLLMAIAGALTFTATIETSVNSNYRQEQVAYFAAKAGLEEARARMMSSDPHPINSALATVAPTTSNQGIVYIVNPGATANSVQPWLSSNQYADDALCHDG